MRRHTGAVLPCPKAPRWSGRSAGTARSVTTPPARPPSCGRQSPESRGPTCRCGNLCSDSGTCNAACGLFRERTPPQRTPEIGGWLGHSRPPSCPASTFRALGDIAHEDPVTPAFSRPWVSSICPGAGAPLSYTQQSVSGLYVISMLSPKPSRIRANGRPTRTHAAPACRGPYCTHTAGR